MFRTIIVFILLALLASLSRADDAGSRVTRVELRSTVRLMDSTDTPTLGDLAKIEGEQASRLLELPIVLDAPIEQGAWSIISPREIRAQIKDAPGILEGGIVLTGPDVRITRVSPRVENLREEQVVATSNDPDRPTLRTQLERWTIDRLDTTSELARIRFDEDDLEALNTPTSGRIVEVREIGRSTRMLVGVVMYENERIILNRSFRFEVLLERPVRVSTQQIKRSTMISHENSKIEHRWLSATEPIADPDSAIGLITVSTIDPGRMIYATNLEAPILVDRGQLVSARSIAGSVSVSMLARAKQSGRIGDIIELESKDRSQSFQARVAGPGQVVILKPNEQSSNPDAFRGVHP